MSVEPMQEMNDEFQNGISVLEKMDDLDFNGETFINDSLHTSTERYINIRIRK